MLVISSKLLYPMKTIIVTHLLLTCRCDVSFLYYWLFSMGYTTRAGFYLDIFERAQLPKFRIQIRFVCNSIRACKAKVFYVVACFGLGAHWWVHVVCLLSPVEYRVNCQLLHSCILVTLVIDTKDKQTDRLAQKPSKWFKIRVLLWIVIKFSSLYVLFTSKSRLSLSFC